MASVLLIYLVVPFGPDAYFANLDVGIFYALAVSSISVIGILIAGWASANKYSLLGGLRAAGQLIAYELPMVLAVVGVVIQAGTLNLQGMNVVGPLVLFAKIIAIAGVIFFVRFTYPRFREDQLQRVAWTVLIPLSLVNILDRFDIDYGLCMYCGICVEVCPFDALFWSPEYEYSEPRIAELLHDKDKLGEWMETVPDPLPLEAGAEKKK